MSDKEAEETKIIIISLLVSNPFRSSIQQLSNDFSAIEGRPIPFKKFGFSTLEDYLHSIPDVVHIYGSGPNAEIEGVVTSKSGHINDMVLRQKKCTNRQNKRRRKKSAAVKKQSVKSCKQRANLIQLVPPLKEPGKSGNEFSEDCVSQKLGPCIKARKTSPKRIPSPKCSKVLQINEHGFLYNETIITDDNYRHSQTDSDSLSRECNFEKLDIINRNKSQVSSNNWRISSFSDDDRFDLRKEDELGNETNSLLSTYVENSSLDENDFSVVPYRVLQNLEKLIQQFPNGIECTQLPLEYRKMFNKKLSYEEYSYRSLIEMCSDLPEIFRYVQKSCDDYILYDSKKPNPFNFERKTSDTKNVEIEKVATTHILKELHNLGWSTDSPIIPPDVVRLSDKISRFFPADITVGDILDISIGEIYDISKFWLFMTYGELEPLMKNLQTFYSKNRVNYLLPEVLIEEGLYCVSLYSGQYHRCVIVNSLPKMKSFVRVLYIDYGTVDNVSINNLWFLSKHFSKVPCQAIRSRLSNIYPVFENQPWSADAVVYFEKLVSNTVIVAEVTRIDEEDHIIEVYLADITDEENIFYINDSLVKAGHALYSDQERKETFSDLNCRPNVQYIHLYPEFYEIESGNAPTTEEMRYIISNKIPLHHYIPQYFDVYYNEDIAAIQKQHEIVNKKKRPEIEFSSNCGDYEFDFSFFPDSMISEIENLYQEQKEDKKSKLSNKCVVENVSPLSFKEYSCNKKRMSNLILGEESGNNEFSNKNVIEFFSSCNKTNESHSSSQSTSNIYFLNNSFQKLNVNNDLTSKGDIFSPVKCANPFLSTNPFVNDITETVNSSNLFEIFEKSSNEKLTQKIVNNLKETHACTCKTNKEINLNKSNARKGEADSPSTMTSDIKSLAPDLLKNEAATLVEPLPQLPGIRTPPGFTSRSTQNNMATNVRNFGPSNFFNNPYFQPGCNVPFSQSQPILSGTEPYFEANQSTTIPHGNYAANEYNFNMQNLSNYFYPNMYSGSNIYPWNH